jgi:hypothetical protein
MRKIHLSIPQPCHENWEAMTEAEKGRFCTACQKTVIDFTNMSDRQLAEFFRKPKSNLCGHFYNDQLDRAIEMPKKRIPWIKYFFQITWPALVFALKASGQSKAKVKAQVNQTSVSKATMTKRSETHQPIGEHATSRHIVPISNTDHAITIDTPAHGVYEDAVIATKPMDEVVIRSLDWRTGRMGGLMVSYRTEKWQKKALPQPPSKFCYPNPVNAGSQLTVSFADVKNVEEVRIVSSVGQVLLRTKQDQSNNSIITIPSHFAAGIYVVEIIGKEKILKTTKLIVVK